MSEKRVITTEWVQTTPDEFRQVYFRLHRKRLSRWAFLGALGFLIAIGGLLMSKQYAVMFGVVVMVLGFGDVLAMRVHIQRLSRYPANSNLFTSARAIVDEEKIVLETESGTRSEIPWAEFISIEKFGDDYLLYLGRWSYVRMFRRAQFEDDWKQFEVWVREQGTKLRTP